MRRTLLWLAGALLLLMLAGCARDLPQNTFDPAGPTAQSEKDVLILPLAIAGVMFVLVEGGIVLLAIRYRHRKGRPERIPKQLHGNTRLEIGWTIAPAVLLAIVVVPAVSLIWELAARPADAMQIKVQGYQWWWGFQYLDDDMRVDYGERTPITVADVMVIPTNTTIDLSLESVGGGARDNEGNADNQVIHSFWAPRLFGKQDVMPGPSGEDNHIVFSAWEAGTYSGQCAEFCGLQHGMMKFRIVALDAPDFQSWVAAQKQPSATPAGGDAKSGMDLFFGTNGEGGQCIACHEIGVGAQTVTNGVAPNLTHFAAGTHTCFAGCDFETFLPGGVPNQDALKAWLDNPGAVKLGAKMPDYNLTPQQIDDLVAYLYTLS